MGADPLESNVARLVRGSALPLDEARGRRAREHFLRAADAAPRRSKAPALALAAAALLFCVVLYAAIRPARPPVNVPDLAPGQEKGAEWIAVSAFPKPEDAQDELYRIRLKISGASRPVRRFRIEGRPLLPEGTALKLRIETMRERLENGLLQPFCAKPTSVPLDVLKGGFEYEWEGPLPERILVFLEVPDSLQDVSILEKLKGRDERMRSRTYLFVFFDERWPALVEPQLLELGAFAKEAGDLFDRVEAACASAELFKSNEKAFTSEAERLQARIEGFAQAGLYPASAQVLAVTVRDLAKSMKDFVWKDGKFDGTSSYYTPGKRGTTHRGDVFGFAELRRYKDEAVAVAGREFLLWIVVDFNRRGLQPDTFGRLLRMRKWPPVPGVVEMVETMAKRAAEPEMLRNGFAFIGEFARNPSK